MKTRKEIPMSHKYRQCTAADPCECCRVPDPSEVSIEIVGVDDETAARLKAAAEQDCCLLNPGKCEIVKCDS